MATTDEAASSALHPSLLFFLPLLGCLQWATRRAATAAAASANTPAAIPAKTTCGWPRSTPESPPETPSEEDTVGAAAEGDVGQDLVRLLKMKKTIDIQDKNSSK